MKYLLSSPPKYLGKSIIYSVIFSPLRVIRIVKPVLQESPKQPQLHHLRRLIHLPQLPQDLLERRVVVTQPNKPCIFLIQIATQDLADGIIMPGCCSQCPKGIWIRFPPRWTWTSLQQNRTAKRGPGQGRCEAHAGDQISKERKAIEKNPHQITKDEKTLVTLEL